MGIYVRLPLQRQKQDGIHQSFTQFTMSSFSMFYKGGVSKLNEFESESEIFA